MSVEVHICDCIQVGELMSNVQHFIQLQTHHIEAIAYTAVGGNMGKLCFFETLIHCLQSGITNVWVSMAFIVIQKVVSLLKLSPKFMAKLVGRNIATLLQLSMSIVPSESIQTPWLIPHFIVLQPELKIMTKWKHIFRNVSKCIENEIQKCLIYIHYLSKVGVRFI